MITDPDSSSGSMLKMVTDGTASQIAVNLQACDNIISGAVAEGNALIEEIIERDK